MTDVWMESSMGISVSCRYSPTLTLLGLDLIAASYAAAAASTLAAEAAVGWSGFSVSRFTSSTLRTEAGGVDEPRRRGNRGTPFPPVECLFGAAVVVATESARDAVDCLLVCEDALVLLEPFEESYREERSISLTFPYKAPQDDSEPGINDLPLDRLDADL